MDLNTDNLSPKLSKEKLCTDSGDPESEPGEPTSWIWRILRAALPFQLALVALFCAACLLEPHCCEAANTLNLSLTPQLRYVRGPPPVWAVSQKKGKTHWNSSDSTEWTTVTQIKLYCLDRSKDWDSFQEYLSDSTTLIFFKNGQADEKLSLIDPFDLNLRLFRSNVYTRCYFL